MWKKSDRIGKINKTRVRQLTRDAQHITEKSFEILREEIGGRVTILKAMKPKRKFIDDEAAFLEEIEASLLEARVVIIEDIQKISDIGSH